MVIFLSILCGAFALLLSASYFVPGYEHIYALFPEFSATAAALIGVLIAGLEYRARKTRKKRRTPKAVLITDAVIGIIATGIWIYEILS